MKKYFILNDEPSATQLEYLLCYSSCVFLIIFSYDNNFVNFFPIVHGRKIKFDFLKYDFLR